MHSRQNEQLGRNDRTAIPTDIHDIRALTATGSIDLRSLSVPAPASKATTSKRSPRIS